MIAQVETAESVAVVTVESTYLDASNSAELKQQVADVLSQAPRVAIDLGRVEFVDSSGCGAILSCLRQINSVGGKLAIFNISKPVRALFELVRLQRILELHETRADALAAIAR